MADYHVGEIPKGVYGEYSKIHEEIMEWQDAQQQGNKIMELLELSDLLGAIDGYVMKMTNNRLDVRDLLVMSDATRRAFISGHRRGTE